jgi:hypothetical protein
MWAQSGTPAAVTNPSRSYNLLASGFSVLARSRWNRRKDEDYDQEEDQEKDQEQDQDQEQDVMPAPGECWFDHERREAATSMDRSDGRRADQKELNARI